MHFDSRLNSLIWGHNLQVMRGFPSESIDLVVTSPPYDNLRAYDGCKFGWCDFQRAAGELWRVIKPGGVVVWVVSDATIKGSETGTSFRQALHFIELGFRLHDTMIWEKTNPIPLSHNRYDPSWEYIFVFSKGTPRTFNKLMEKCRSTGHKKDLGRYAHGDLDKATSIRRRSQIIVVGDQKLRCNIWRYPVGGAKSFKHPAVFPLALARDHILSWSNEGDIVLDPFAGSATTCVAAKLLNRPFIGIEISEEYVKRANERLNSSQSESLGEVLTDATKEFPLARATTVLIPALGQTTSELLGILRAELSAAEAKARLSEVAGN